MKTHINRYISRPKTSYLARILAMPILTLTLVFGPLTHVALAVPPNTMLDSYPVSPSPDNTPSFGFSSFTTPVSFECSIDNEPFVPCSSPYLTSTPRVNGSHTFAVQAVNSSFEVDPTPEIYTWVVAAFDGGDGSSGDPYQISTCDQLQAVKANLSASYVLVDNVNCTSATFTPIGTSSDPFTGNLNGQGHTITNLSINQTSTSYVGLFGDVDGSLLPSRPEIKNFMIKDSSFNGDGYVGAVAGRISKADILDVRVSNTTITGNSDRVGGITGSLGGADITRSSFQGQISSVATKVGGLAGNMVGPSNIGDSFAKISIEGTDHVGGLVGYADSGTQVVGDSYAIVTFTTTMGTRGELFATVIGTIYDQNNFAVTNISGTMADGSTYKNTSSYGPLGSWSFGPSGIWHVNYNDYPSLTPIFGPEMLCTSPIQYLTSLSVSCDYIEAGWGTTTWEAEYQETGATSWTRVVLASVHSGAVTVTGTRADRDYKVRVRYTNDHGTSSWGVVDFLNFAGGDSDSDGVNDYLEGVAPNGGDANNDGQLDSGQANVTSDQDEKSGQYFTLVTPTCNDNYNVMNGAQPSSSPDTGYSYYTNQIRFTARACGTPGANIPIQIYFYGDYDASKAMLRKYDTATNTYTKLPSVSFTNLTIGGKKVLKASYSITDGGQFDVDGVADGNITDPVGLAVSIGSPNTGIQPQAAVTPFISTSAGLVALMTAYAATKKRRNNY